MLHRLAMGLFLAALAIASPASARGDAGGPNDATVPIQISLRVGEQPYVFGGEGICQHAAEASIYEAPALLWSARHSEARRSLNLSFWRLQKGGDMMTLSLNLGDASHRVNTVKVGEQGVLQGSGRTTFTAGGQGGTFTIEAAAKDGTRISGTIACGRFSPIVEEGGD